MFPQLKLFHMVLEIAFNKVLNSKHFQLNAEEAQANEDNDERGDNGLEFPDDLNGNHGGSTVGQHSLRQLIDNAFECFNGGKSNASKPHHAVGASDANSFLTRLFIFFAALVRRSESLQRKGRMRRGFLGKRQLYHSGHQ